MKTYKDEKKFVGNVQQLFRVNRLEFTEGKADGVKIIDVANRSGMHFAVNVSRGLDITYLDYNGENIGFLAPCGVVHPAYFDDKGLGLLKSFAPGMLTTCGLKHAGAPCEFDGASYGLHGNFSHQPAENCNQTIVECEECGKAKLVIEGDIRDAVIFGDKLSAHRKIECVYGERSIRLHDKVTNDGGKKARHMILYHCNIGYPVLSPESEVFIPSAECKPRTEHSKEGLAVWNKLQAPDPDYEEMCYYHKLKSYDGKRARVAIFNPETEVGIGIDFALDTLDHFVEWKMMGVNDYVMGLEPGNSTIDGIADAIENGSMKYLGPGESVEYDLEFRVLSGKAEFEAYKY